jgi:hypothetical protein
MSKFRNSLFVHQLAGAMIRLATSITSPAQASEAADESGTSTSHSSTTDANPYRAKESH